MSEFLSKDERFKKAVASVKDGLSKRILSRSTDEAERTEALRKYHLIDDVVAAVLSDEHH